MTPYATEIARYTNIDPRIVESFMRLEYGTLDHLSKQKFAAECKMAEVAFDADPDTCKALARSYGYDIQ